MTEVILKIPRNKKGRALLQYLRQIEFIEVDETSLLSRFQAGLHESLKDLKSGRVRSWKNKTIQLRNA